MPFSPAQAMACVSHSSATPGVPSRARKSARLVLAYDALNRLTTVIPNAFVGLRKFFLA